ncbi:MAG TPA: ATP-dependent Clp protease adaptor ClpS [Bryobacterales bacterium]|nr:ATP-dependent Clp protease adaptor ClpS [Bryobacterales bacterium]
MATVVLPEIGEEVVDRLEPLYHVILLDDDDHTYDYVVEMLVKIFGFTETVAFRHAVEVDTDGRTLVATCPLEEAERKRDAVHAYGPDWRLERSKGSMSAIIEPAGPSED